jgi:hypothetical protein
MLICYPELCMVQGAPMEAVYAKNEFDMPVVVSWEVDANISKWAEAHSEFISRCRLEAIGHINKKVVA